MPARVALFALSLALVPAAHSQADSTPTDSTRVGPSAALTDWHRDGAGGFDVLPVRSVRGVAAWAPGVRRDLATGALAVRAHPNVAGSRLGGGPRVVVNGVRGLGVADLPFESVERVRVLTEAVSARYGDAAGGLLLVDAEADADTLGGRLEGYSSRATDAYGTDLGALAVRVPLGTWGGFAVAAEVGHQADASPYGVSPYQLTDEAYEAVQTQPQALVVRESGETRYVPFPAAEAQTAEAAGAPLTETDLRRVLGLSAGAEIAPGLVPIVETFGEDAYERRPAKADPLDDLRLAAGLTLRPAASVAVRLSGRLAHQRAARTGTPADLYARLLLNQDATSDVEADALALAATVEHAVTPAVRYRLGVSGERAGFVSRPSGFSDRVEDLLDYSDIDAEAAAVARRYFVVRNPSGGPVYRSLYARDSGSRPGRVSGLGFYLPGGAVSRYDRSASESFVVHGALRLDLGPHGVEVGGSVERETHRRFSADGFGLAGYAADANGPEYFVDGFPNGVADYADLPFGVLSQGAAGYGYSYNGLQTTDAEDVDAYLPNRQGVRENTDLAPFRPVTVAGYLLDEVALGAIDLRFGLRVEAYDANATVPLDLYAPLVIVRASDLAQVPEGVGPDFAVYYGAAEAVVGYRDLEANFYDASGAPATAQEITLPRGGHVRQTDAPGSTAFRDAPLRVSVEPRVDAAFQATDVLRLRVTWDRLSRRPDPSFYAPFSDYEEVSSASVIGNAALRPERVEAVRLGADVRLTPFVAVSAAGFVRRANDLPIVRRLTDGYPSYVTVTNDGEVHEMGVDVAAAWAPSPTVWVRGAYTLASATVGSGLIQPGELGAAAGDTRHAIDLIAAARVPRGGGPQVGGVAVLGGLSAGLALSAQSGLPYTALVDRGYSVADPFTGESAGTARLPWTHQLDLRLDKPIPIRGGAVDVFVWVENLLDVDNVLAVYRSTRQPDVDGYLGSAVANERLDTPEREFLYRAYTTGAANVGGNQSTTSPYVYGRPRQIRLGVRASF